MDRTVKVVEKSGTYVLTLPPLRSLQMVQAFNELLRSPADDFEFMGFSQVEAEVLRGRLEHWQIAARRRWETGPEEATSRSSRLDIARNDYSLTLSLRELQLFASAYFEHLLSERQRGNAREDEQAFALELARQIGSAMPDR